MADIDIYLKLDGIPGDSTADRHAGEIVVLSYRTDIEAKFAAHLVARHRVAILKGSTIGLKRFR